MRRFTIAADVVMGAILGLFVYVAAAKTWPRLEGFVAAILLILACVAIVLFRSPNGSLRSRTAGDRQI
jgi:asparagine N-glycosylation enzyme membrane subunit Stt3